ncbi:MAG TPA: hypothetical protein VL326_00545 [Kofleriaceae bacterium]|nr:hypothetical protein [Kofleriaceae bacterium]
MNVTNEHHRRSKEMSHASIAALAVAVVVVGGVSLIFMSRQFHDHPGAVLGLILGVSALIVLTYVIGRRRGHV